MMVKEGYKETTLGTIPEDWILYKLEEIISINQGNALSTKSHKDDGYPVFGANGQIGYYDEFSHLNSEVLLTCRGSTCGTINKSKPKSYITNNSMVLSPKEKKEINKEFLYYIMKKVNYSKFITGTGQPQITKNEIKSAQIPIPEVKEQKKIADILSTVDENIAKTEEVKEKTKELKKGLMQQLLTKGIGHSEFKEVKIGPQTIKIPKVWKQYNLNELTSLIKDGTHNPPQRVEDGVPLLSATNIEDGKLKFDKTDNFIKEEDYKEMHKKYSIEPGDVLLTCVGTLGRTMVVKDDLPKFTVQRSVAIFKLNEKINSYYCYYFFQSHYFQQDLKRRSNATAQAGVYLNELSKMVVFSPPLEEQKKIANILSTVDEKIQKEEEYKEKLELLKKGLMQKLLTGEVRVKVAN